MIQALIGPISGLVGSWMDSKTEEQRGKTAVAKAKAEAEAAVMVSAATSTAEWEKLMAKGSQNSSRMNGSTIFFASPHSCILRRLGPNNRCRGLCGVRDDA